MTESDAVPATRRFSLRMRLLLIAIGLLAAALAIGNTVAIGALERYQIGRLDNQIRPIAAILAAAPYSPDQAAVAPDPDVDPAVVAGLGRMFGFSYVAYLLPDGTVLDELDLAQFFRTAAAPRPALSGLDADAVAARDGRPFNVPGERGSGRWRAVALPLSAAAVPPEQASELAGASVVVAASRAEADDAVAQLRTITLVVGAVMLALLVVGGWFAVGAGLRPLGRIEETAAGIAAGDLTRRVPQVGAPRTEVGRLSAALNGMLGQIESAFAARARSEARMRRFVADVSHELRTPLFGIHGFTELYRMGGLPKRSDVDRTMDRIERESARLAGLTEDLLLLARLDEQSAGGAPALQPAPMDLRTLAADAHYDLTGLDPTRPVSLTGPGDAAAAGSAPVLGDEARLRQVVTNLVGNAVAHTPPGTPVRIGVGTVAGEAVLELADQGPGMTPDQADRVFDRFYRADDSRTRTGGAGAGLGLAIARSLVEAHGGRIELTTAPGLGTTFRVVLPAASSKQPGSEA